MAYTLKRPQQHSHKSDQVPFTAISCSFHSLFRVLFTFPSQYLCAIGVAPIFSLRSQLTPSFELHSQATRLFSTFVSQSAPTWLIQTGISPFLLDYSSGVNLINHQDATITRRCVSLQFDRLRSLLIQGVGLDSCSFATTEEIPVGFFSFA